MRRLRRFPSDPPAEVVHDGLVRCGMFVPVSLGGAEERAWLDCDLASLAENRIGDSTHPRDLDDRRRAEWGSRITGGPPQRLEARSEYDRCYWVLDGGDRVGTVALATSVLGGTRLRLSSFYIFP